MNPCDLAQKRGTLKKNMFGANMSLASVVVLSYLDLGRG